MLILIYIRQFQPLFEHQFWQYFCFLQLFLRYLHLFTIIIWPKQSFYYQSLLSKYLNYYYDINVVQKFFYCFLLITTCLLLSLFLNFNHFPMFFNPNSIFLHLVNLQSKFKKITYLTSFLCFITRSFISSNLFCKLLFCARSKSLNYFLMVTDASSKSLFILNISLKIFSTCCFILLNYN